MTITGQINSETLNNGVPIFAPPYRWSKHWPRFTDVNCITIRYRTDGSSIRQYIPDNLQIEETPIVTIMLLDFGFSVIGPYHELIHCVEVTYEGKKYNYSFLLILDNEEACIGGRELLGNPKVLGTIEFDRQNRPPTAFIHGRVLRPSNTVIADIHFKPLCLVLDAGESKTPITGLNLRLIPSLIPGAPPSVREYTNVDFTLQGGEVWEGVGSLNFPSNSEFEPLHKFPVLEYLSATYHRGAWVEQRLLNVYSF
ncbi:hypothetical protein COCC4DRAFT_155400 [Bipolaris maydis ATCC 48331]|uniref:Decarboxylase DEC1 n=1 Tax=Cochliobolus heterostrophus (strain C4 / ATCC 48331 / race T) TaxID=665024 RepID=DEC1_COCH4|nr:uncharacterized protein COCC4DRAFT_155400 [Bipolaris maydis ATCC 48331]Q8NJQ3.1 RecName: Full=Decarboxylase DEC1; AltName: Full=T-toxin biosynthesis protein DEC1 [Bipolaris maydis ATCC 48331]AAM88291.1 decarboxylase DEC1 [Bipolaris maydis]ENH98583.1 hypothetical protein COCC4DRAFT_155400 [Bipolaris maydis ATCC 48331]KAJ5026275.1 acetoacetate decarboxylase [Bipolaris maydis]KAJ5051356.1 decarboxylase DEC1 [Bipolaris maydis]KAJ6196401.1 decarboxylase DEC1 [Bipolaris maydis]